MSTQKQSPNAPIAFTDKSIQPSFDKTNGQADSLIAKPILTNSTNETATIYDNQPWSTTKITENLNQTLSLNEDGIESTKKNITLETPIVHDDLFTSGKTTAHNSDSQTSNHLKQNTYIKNNEPPKTFIIENSFKHSNKNTQEQPNSKQEHEHSPANKNSSLESSVNHNAQLSSTYVAAPNQSVSTAAVPHAAVQHDAALHDAVHIDSDSSAIKEHKSATHIDNAEDARHESSSQTENNANSIGAISDAGGDIEAGGISPSNVYGDAGVSGATDGIDNAVGICDVEASTTGDASSKVEVAEADEARTGSLEKQTHQDSKAINTRHCRLRPRSKLKRIASYALGSLAAFCGLIIGGMYACAPDLSKFHDRSYVLYDQNGEIIYEKMNDADYHRILTTKEMVDPIYLNMLIASEDERFYSHFGVDPIAIGRAFLSNITSLKRVSGASTISMQVCRMLEPKDRNLFSKVREALGAMYLTWHYGRDEILTMYLTMAPFGGNIEGVTAASYQYFNHSPKYLSPSEAALLVALPRSPEVIRPDRHPRSAIYYRNEVLKRAVENGVISEDVLKSATLAVLPSKKFPIPNPAYHLGQSIFTGKLITPNLKALITAIAASDPENALNKEFLEASNQISEDNVDEAQNASPLYYAEQKDSNIGTKTSKSNVLNLLNDPLFISQNLPRELYTTIDSSIQQNLIDVAKEYRHSMYLEPSSSIGLLAVDNRNFRVLGYLGSFGREHSYVDAVQALRSPGSALKPFAYGMAFEEGLLHPKSILLDASRIFESYQPRNYSRTYIGEVSASLALQASLNLPALDVVTAIGPINFVNRLNSIPNAEDSNYSKPDNAYALTSSYKDDSNAQDQNYIHGRLVFPYKAKPSINVVLGGTGISLYNLTQLYTALAHDGESYPLEVIDAYPKSIIRNSEIGKADLSSNGHYSAADDKLGIAIAVLDKLKPEDKNSVTLAPKNKATGIRKVASYPHPYGSPTKLLDASAARATYKILEGVPAPHGFSTLNHISYKTGTSYKFRDTLAIGSKDNLTVGVWTGRNDGGPGIELSGYSRAAPILFKILTRSNTERVAKPFLPAFGVLGANPPVALTKVDIKEQGRVRLSESSTQAYAYTNGRSQNSYHAPFKPSGFLATEPLNISFPTTGSRLSVGSTGTIMVSFSGGVSPYYLLINDKLNDSLQSFTPDHDGIYTITIIDSTGASITSQVFVQGTNQ